MNRFLPAFLLLSTAAAVAQPKPISFNLTGDGAGVPGQITASTTTGSLNPLGVISRLDIWGGQYGLGSRQGGYVFIFTLSNNDILSFADNTSAVSATDSATGTASLQYGTGLFHGAAGNFTYTFACTFGCYKGTGTPTFGQFKFSFSGQGTLDLPTSAGEFAPVISPLVNGYTSVYRMTPQGNVIEVRVYDGSSRTRLNIEPNRLASHSTGAQVEDALSIALPWQSVPFNYNVTASCPGLPVCWISIPAATGTNAAFHNSAVTANIDASSLAPGVYPGVVAISTTPSGQPNATPSTKTLNFTLIVTTPAPYLTLSETGIVFRAVSTVQPSPLTRQISILTSSSTPLTFQAIPTTPSGKWLSISSSSGTTSYSTPAAITVTANPAGLAPGTYYGRVDVSAPEALDSPQSFEVQLNVAASDNQTVMPSTAGLIFVVSQSANPIPQTFTLSTLSNAALKVTTGAEYGQSGHWFTVGSSTTSFTSAQPITQTVTVNTTGLAPGIYDGIVHQFESTAKKDYPVRVLLVVTPSSGVCTPTKLLPVLTSLTTGFQVTVGDPVPVAAQLLDDCGATVSSGSLVAKLSADDAAILMSPLGGGRWSGTWQPRAATSQGTVTLTAMSPTSLQGFSSTVGSVVANTKATIIYAGGVVSAASLKASAPLAPGAFITIVGTNLASATATASSDPLPTTLSGTRVLLGGQPLPLQFVSAGQINAIVPYGATMNQTQQLLIESSGVYSFPETVSVAATSPAVFTQTGSGKGAGAIVVTKADGTQFVASAVSPATAGDVLSIYCSGLGAVNPALAEGAVAPSSPLSRTGNAVTVTIGGQSTEVLFAGLAPGAAGLYQVNVLVPSGIAPDANVPVVVTSAGAISGPVTVAIQ